MDWNLGTAARTLWQEARGEPLDGQKAVAHVLVNRLKTGRWGKSLAEVCLWYLQFSGWRDVDPNFGISCRMPDDSTALVQLAGLIEAAQAEPDPTDGATHYYANTIKPPAWTLGATFCGKFGNQLFYKNVR